MFDENDEHQECFYILQNLVLKSKFTAYEHRLTTSSLFVKT
jgi:hypothetical protein